MGYARTHIPELPGQTKEQGKTKATNMPCIPKTIELAIYSSVSFKIHIFVMSKYDITPPLHKMWGCKKSKAINLTAKVLH